MKSRDALRGVQGKRGALFPKESKNLAMIRWSDCKSLQSRRVSVGGKRRLWKWVWILVLFPDGGQPSEASELLCQHGRQLQASPSGLRATQGRARSRWELQNCKIQVFRSVVPPLRELRLLGQGKEGYGCKPERSGEGQLCTLSFPTSTKAGWWGGALWDVSLIPNYSFAWENCCLLSLFPAMVF